VCGSVRFQPEQISAVTDSVPEQWRPNRTITIQYVLTVRPRGTDNDSQDLLQVRLTLDCFGYRNRLD